MGNVVKTIGSVFTAPIQMLGGKGPLAEMLGVEKKQGEFYNPDNTPTDMLVGENKYLAGDKSKTDVNAYLKYGNLKGNNLSREAVALDPVAGSKLAAEEVMNSPLMRGLFGNNSLSSRLNAEEQDLAKNGFNLTQDDRTAYGQASGDIARMFGNQENDIATSLAKRGLASAGSGAAGAAYSGVAGNKYEQLGKLQTDIANKRYASNMERLNDTRSQINNLATLGQKSQAEQFNRQIQGVQNRRDYLSKAALLQQASNEQTAASLQDKRNNMGKSLLQGFGQGLFSSAQQMGSSPGTLSTSFAGSAGKTLGGGGFMGM